MTDKDYKISTVDNNKISEISPDDINKAILAGMSTESRRASEIVHDRQAPFPANPFKPVEQASWEKGNKNFDPKRDYDWLLK